MKTSKRHKILTATLAIILLLSFSFMLVGCGDKNHTDEDGIEWSAVTSAITVTGVGGGRFPQSRFRTEGNRFIILTQTNETRTFTQSFGVTIRIEWHNSN